MQDHILALHFFIEYPLVLTRGLKDSIVIRLWPKHAFWLKPYYDFYLYLQLKLEVIDSFN